MATLTDTSDKLVEMPGCLARVAEEGGLAGENRPFCEHCKGKTYGPQLWDSAVGSGAMIYCLTMRVMAYTTDMQVSIFT